jgi:hypothetical protein
MKIRIIKEVVTNSVPKIIIPAGMIITGAEMIRFGTSIFFEYKGVGIIISEGFYEVM